MPSDDIVALLRVLNHHAKKLSENESLHDLHRDALTRCENLTWQAADEIERLRAERDEARRSVCCQSLPSDYKEWNPSAVDSALKLIAAQQGWDCFDEPVSKSYKSADEIERLRKERDEARRSVCEMSIQFGGVFRRVGGKTVEVTTPQGCAEIMRWDCFKDARDER